MPLACFSPLTGILVMRRRRISIAVNFGYKCFSPLTGILVMRLCLSVPAPWLGSQAIFSNLRLFSPFSGTRVKNKNQAMAIIGLVMPFFAGLKIFKPRRFLTLKSVFQRSILPWLISSILFFGFCCQTFLTWGRSFPAWTYDRLWELFLRLRRFSVPCREPSSKWGEHSVRTPR